MFHQYGYIFSLGAWGFTIVFVSLLSLYLGIWIDSITKTEPTFTFGLFFLGLVLSIGRLYRDAWEKREK